MKKLYPILLLIAVGFAIKYYLDDNPQILAKIKGEIERVETPKNNTQTSGIKENKSEKIYCTLPYFKEGQIVKHKYYSFQYSEKDEQALWVAYKLTPNHLVKNVKRKDNFRTDEKVNTGSATLNDYKKSGYDRGHLTPAGSMTFDETAMDESFYMSNMSPQKPRFNRGIWKKLETLIRNWVKVSDSLYVVSGPVLNDIDETIGNNKVSVPKQYYKVILKFNDNKTQAIGFLLENKSSKAPLQSFAVPIDSIEKVTGVDFNYNLSNLVEAKLESTFDPTQWKY